MKTTNYILKAMENLMTNDALLSAVRSNLVNLSNSEYQEISDAMAKKEFQRPLSALRQYIESTLEMYNYLEQLMLEIEKPF